ncbi:MAG: sulfotransferase family protein [Gammaproteobacteria bacterium]|nr:MAG: sulfotransferase family protein [Gammaproteobacteria bacterium]
MPPLKIIYIGGWGRSGSSLLANVLGSYAQLASVGELRYLWDRGLIENKRCGCGQPFRDCDFWPAALADAGLPAAAGAAARFAARVGSRATLAQIRALLTGSIEHYQRRHAGEIARLRALYLAAARRAGVDTLVDASKTPPYVINLLGQPGVELCFLHLLRDPRAVAWSWSRRRASGEADDDYLPRYSAFKCALYWNAFNLFALAFRKRPGVRYLRLRYEDFARAPRASVERILREFGCAPDGLDWEGPRSLEVQPQHSISGNPSRFRTGTVTIRADEEWRNRLPAARRRLVTTLCAPLLPVFGYPLRHVTAPLAAEAADEARH